jgi:hypothetical protein
MDGESSIQQLEDATREKARETGPSHGNFPPNPTCQVETGGAPCEKEGQSRVMVVGGFSYLAKRATLQFDVWVCADHYKELWDEQPTE